MLLKRLYEDYDLNIERILSKEQRRLKLSSDEMVVLLAFFSLYKRRTFSIKAISKRVELDDNKIGKIIDKLIEKAFIILELENKDGKEREVFDLSPTFNKLEELFSSDEKEKSNAQNKSHLLQTINLIESFLLRALSSYELDTLRTWYEENTYTHEIIIEYINKFGPQARFSFRYLERQLMKVNHKLTVEPNEEADKALDKVFKAIK